MISVLASAPSPAERAIGVAEHLSVLVWMPLNMISVLPVTPKPCRKHNWGSGMPLDTASKDPKHDFGAASHPQGASKGRLGCWNAAECPFEGPST
mgnify:CR=1 FL=1